jgi:hypothetical protein
MNNASWTGRNAAILFAALLAVGMAGITAFDIADRSSRIDLEPISQPTAVGDKPGLAIFDKKIQATPLGTISGHPIFAAAAELEKRRDCEMARTATDDSGALTLYRPESGTDAQTLFVKAERDRFLRIGPNPPQSTPPPSPAR